MMLKNTKSTMKHLLSGVALTLSFTAADAQTIIPGPNFNINTPGLNRLAGIFDNVTVSNGAELSADDPFTPLIINYQLTSYGGKITMFNGSVIGAGITSAYAIDLSSPGPTLFYADGLNVGGAWTLYGGIKLAGETTVTIKNAAINATYGIVRTGSGPATFENVTINSAVGLMDTAGYNPPHAINIKDSTINASSIGISANGSSLLNVESSNIHSQINAAVQLIKSVPGSPDFSITGGSLISDQSSALEISGADIAVKINGTTITGAQSGIYASMADNLSLKLTGANVSGENTGMTLLSAGKITAEINGGNITGRNEGIYISSMSPDTSLNVANATVSANTATGKGIDFWNGNIQITGSTVNGGSLSPALFIAGQANALIESSTLNGGFDISQHPYMSGSQVNLVFRNSVANGMFQAANASTGTTNISVEAHNTIFTGYVTNLSSNTPALFNWSLNDNSKLYGQIINVNEFAIDRTSEWHVPNNPETEFVHSRIAGSLTNNGHIYFDVPSSNYFSPVTINGDLKGTGYLHMNTNLAALQGDHISIIGNTSGTQTVLITNHGAAPTSLTGSGPSDGLQIISVGGSSAGSFVLGAPVIVGIYDYALNKADGQNWYLQNAEYVPPTPPPGPGPGPGPNPNQPLPPPPSAPQPPHVVDTVGAYLDVPDAAGRMIINSLDNVRGGVTGGVANGLSDRNDDRRESGNHAWNVWGKATGWTGSFGKGYAYDASGLVGQIGLDYSLRNVAIGGDRTRLGVWIGFGSSTASVKNSTAKFDLNGPQAGAYAMYNQEGSATGWGRGITLDAMAIYAWLDTDLSAKAISGHTIRASYNANSWGLSAEGGYGFGLTSQTIFRPMIGFTYTQVDTPSFADSASMRVGSAHNNAMTTSAGLRLEHRLDQDKTTTVWIYGGGEHESASSVKLRANDIFVANRDTNGLRGVIAAGIKGAIGQNTEISGSAALSTGKNLENEIRGSLGIRTRF